MLINRFVDLFIHLKSIFFCVCLYDNYFLLPSLSSVSVSLFSFKRNFAFEKFGC